MDAGVVLLNFGEPAEPTREAVIPFLERIFLDNASLERFDSEGAARERASELANRRAAGLIEEYETIGGSPLHEQAEAQAAMLEAELDSRGYDVAVELAMQYTEPLIPEVAAEMAAHEFDRVIVVPVYPLSGPSTNIAAVDSFERALAEANPQIEMRAVTGWHRHPTYTRLRFEAIREFLTERDLEVSESDTEFLFSAHGTPVSYLEAGSRYDVYVEEYAETMASLLDLEEYTLGFQNHANRDIAWTEPDIETALESVDAERVVVEPMSFLHEQSETLHELDIELREEAEALGMEFFRVPVPHDDSRLGAVIGDLLEPFLANFEPSYHQLRPCQCRDADGTYCLNAPLE
ncbi:MAG: ferrochelatase [Halodesulfurarchaeum sp.]